MTAPAKRLAVATALVLLATAGGPGPAGAQDSEIETLLTVQTSSGVGGRLTEPVCLDGQTLTPSAFGARVSALRAPSPEPRIILDTGGLLAPHGVARFAARNQPEELADLVQGLGYDALMLGESDLGAPRGAMIRAFSTLAGRGIPVIATNLYCDPTGRELCDVVVDGNDGLSIHAAGEHRVALIGLVAPAALQRLAPEGSRGIRLAPVAETMGRAVRAARERGATLVVVSLDDGLGSDAAAGALAMGALPPEDKPDVLLSAGAGSEFLFARPAAFRPAVVAAPPGGVVAVRVRRNRVTGTFDVLAQPFADADPEDAGPAVTQFIDEVGPVYCERWGRELAGGSLDRDLDAAGMLDLVADTMRAATGAEVALLNRAALDERWAPARPRGLTASDVYLALQYDEPLMTAVVEGPWLEKVAKALDRAGLRGMGLTVTDGKVEINGRALEPRGTYHVVTIRFLALGGDSALPEGPEWQPVASATLRSVMLERLEEASTEDPRDRLPDARDTPVWSIGLDSDLAFTGSRVANSEGYTDSQLQRENTSALGINIAVRADGIGRLWGWDNGIQLQYQSARTGAGAFEEALDQIIWRSTARWRGFRELRDEPYVPDPFVESYLETELSEAEGAEYHHLLLRPVLGLQFTLTDHLSFKISGGFELEALAPDASVLPGFGAQVVLKPWTYMSNGHRAAELAFTADYFVAGVGDENRQTFRGALTATLALTRLISLGVSYDLYALKEGGRDFSLASNGTAFLRVTWFQRLLGPQ